MVVVHYEDFSSIILANELILIWLFLFLNFASEIFASNLCGAGTFTNDFYDENKLDV